MPGWAPLPLNGPQPAALTAVPAHTQIAYQCALSTLNCDGRSNKRELPSKGLLPLPRGTVANARGLSSAVETVA